MLVAIKGTGERQTCRQLGRDDARPGAQLRGLCVHAVGGDNGKTLTCNRRNAIRKAHNKKCGEAGGRCSLHVGSWKAKLQRQFNVSSEVGPRPRRGAAPPPAQVQAVVVAAPAPVQDAPVAMNVHTQLQSFMAQLDDNRDGMSDGTYLRVANVLHTAFHQAGAQ